MSSTYKIKKDFNEKNLEHMFNGQFKGIIADESNKRNIKMEIETEPNSNDSLYSVNTFKAKPLRSQMSNNKKMQFMAHVE